MKEIRQKEIETLKKELEDKRWPIAYTVYSVDILKYVDLESNIQWFTWYGEPTSASIKPLNFNPYKHPHTLKRIKQFFYRLFKNKHVCILVCHDLDGLGYFFINKKNLSDWYKENSDLIFRLTAKQFFGIKNK